MIRQTSRVLIVLAVIAIVSALLGSIHNQRKATKSIFDASLTYWEQDIATAIENKNWLWIGKFGTTLSQNGLESILFLVNEKPVFSYPTEGVTENQCSSPFLRSIIHYGVEIGTVKACVSQTAVFRAAILSPVFFVAMLIVIGLVSLSSREMIRTKADAEKGKALSQLAAQVSHDIRSPLAVLTGLIDEQGNINEKNKPHVRTAVNRIRDIANNLLANNRAVHRNISTPKTEVQPSVIVSTEPRTVTLLPIALESSVSQKRLQYSDRPTVDLEFVMDCGAMSSGIFCSLQLTELDRILSNLINNAYEAISGRGKITVTLSVLSGTAQVSVKDTGKGIPKELLPKIGLAHQTFGKKDGNGLGVFYAKTVVASWGGSLVIDSVEGQGTTITIGIPLADTPTWFASELNIRPNSLVVIADDDPSIHALWKQKLAILKNVTSTLKTVHLNSGKDLLNWYREFALSDRPEDQTEHVVYFCDYEFSGESQNGIDLLEMMGASRQSVLFTSRWNEKSVLDRCERLHIRLLPKQLANHVVLSPAAGNT